MVGNQIRQKRTRTREEAEEADNYTFDIMQRFSTAIFLATVFTIVLEIFMWWGYGNGDVGKSLMFVFFAVILIFLRMCASHAVIAWRAKGDVNLVTIGQMVIWGTIAITMFCFVDFASAHFSEYYHNQLRKSEPFVLAKQKIEKLQQERDGIIKVSGSTIVDIENSINQIGSLKTQKNAEITSFENEINQINLAESNQLKALDAQIEKERQAIRAKHAEKISAIEEEIQQFWNSTIRNTPMTQIMYEDGTAKTDDKGRKYTSAAREGFERLQKIQAKMPSEYNSETINSFLSEKTRVKNEHSRKVSEVRAKIDEVKVKYDIEIATFQNLATYIPQLERIDEQLLIANANLEEKLETTNISAGNGSFELSGKIVEMSDGNLKPYDILTILFSFGVFIMLFGTSYLGQTQSIIKNLDYTKIAKISEQRRSELVTKISNIFNLFWENGLKQVIMFFVGIFLALSNTVKGIYKILSNLGNRMLEKTEKTTSVKKRVTRVPTLSPDMVVQPAPAFNSKSVMTEEEFKSVQKSRKTIAKFRNGNNGDTKSKKTPLKQKSSQFDLDF